MIGGVLGPEGLMCVRCTRLDQLTDPHPYDRSPPKSSALFIAIIVQIPLVQIFTIVSIRCAVSTIRLRFPCTQILGLFVLAIDWPLPFLSQTVFSRSPIFKMALHFVLGFLSRESS